MAITFIGAASAASNTVDLPSFQAGDVAIASVNVGAAPAGWTTLRTNDGFYAYAAWRILQPGDTTTGSWSGGASNIVVVVYRGVAAVAPLGDAQSVTNTSTTIITVPALSTSSNNHVVAIGKGVGTGDSGSFAPTNMTNRAGRPLVGIADANSDGSYAGGTYDAGGNAGVTLGIAIALQAESAFPIVADQDTISSIVTSNSSSWTLTYPANISAGDLLLLFSANDGTSSFSPTTSGWIGTNVNSGANSLNAWAYKADGTETGTFTYTTFNTAEQGAWIIYRIPAGTWHGSLSETWSGGLWNCDGAAGAISVTGSPSLNPNPPSLDPANWGTTNTLWFAVMSADTSRTVSGYPTDFINTGYLESGGSTGATLGWARLESAVASLDPGTFTISNSDDWVAATIAVRPFIPPTFAFAQARAKISAVVFSQQDETGGPYYINYKMAQEFTPEYSMNISAVGVKIAKDIGTPTDAHTISISDSLTGTALASTTFEAETITTSKYYYFNFGSLAILNAETTYYLGITRTAYNGSNRLNWDSSNSDVIAGSVWNDLGSGWAEAGPSDLVIVLFGNIEVSTRNRYGQAQAKIGTSATTYTKSAQTQARIKTTSYVYGQTKAQIKRTYIACAQAKAQIKSVGFGFAQSKVQIVVTQTSVAQVQAAIKQTSQGYAQSKASIKTTTSTYAQSGADIKQTSQAYAQARVWIEITQLVFAQAFVWIRVETYKAAQAQAQIYVPVYTYTAASQAQAQIKVTSQAYAQIGAQVKTTYQGYAQAKSWIEQSYQGYGQARTAIKTSYQGYAQSQSDIKATSSKSAQACTQIKTTYQGFGQAKTQIKTIYSQSAQNQAQIKQTYTASAQAQTYILLLQQSYAQALATIFATSTVYAQAQAQILGEAVITRAYAQAQAHIKAVSNAYAQAGAKIRTTGNTHGQAVALIYIPVIAYPVSDVANNGWVRVVI